MSLRERKIRVRFIEKQLEFCQQKIDELKNLPYEEEYERGLMEGLEHEVFTLKHLLENCAE